MEMLDMNVTNGSNSTAILEPSVVELITFAALSWGIVVIFAAIIRYLRRDDADDGYKEDIWRRLCGVIAVTVTVTAAVVVVGSVLSAQNGDSTRLSSEGVAGHVLLILTMVTALLVWALFLTVLVIALYEENKKCFGAYFAVLGIVFGTLFVIGVALLGWSSFEFDTIQGNGSKSTITPGLRTAGVVISSLGLGSLVVIVISLVCRVVCFDAYVRRQETKETLDTRLKKSRLLLEEALKHGYVECRTVVCLLVGVAGAGKTHTQHLLLRKKPPKSRNSTPMAVKPIRAVLVSANSGQLQEVSIDHLDKRIAAAIATGVSLKKKTLCCGCFGKDNQITSEGISQPPLHSRQQEVNLEEMDSQTASEGISRPPPRSRQQEVNLEEMDSQTASEGISRPPPRSRQQEVNLEEIQVATSHNRNFCCCCSTPLDSNSKQLLDTTNSSLDKTAHQIANTSGPQQLLSGDWIYLIDSGGQIEFLEALPAFLRHTSVCLFVTNLSEELGNRPKIEYYEDGKPVGEPILCPFTNEQMLMRCVQTIQTQCTIQEDSANKGQGSQLAIVGTHRDLEDKCSESREVKNKKLHRELSPVFGKSLIFYGQQMKKLIFPVNAKTPNAEDHRVAEELTKAILKLASSLEPRKTPISWFEFEKNIHMSRKKLLHWKECLQIARMLHLSKKDLNAVLDHLTNFGVIHYYPHLLPDVVFVDPQFLLDKISELVKFHYKLKCDPRTTTQGGLQSYPKTAIEGKWQKFRNEGCITLKLLNEFSEEYTTFFTAADFLKLMKDRLIVTDLIRDNEYFMPCLLRTMESQEIDQYRVTASGVAPLAIHFSCKLVPHGVFCSLVAFLQSSQNSSPWSLFPCPNDPTEPQCLTRNCIKFQLPEDAPGSLTLIDAFSHFKVYVQAEHTICVRLCPSIWRTLVQGIQKAAKTLKYQLVPKQAFLCSKHKNTQPHLALPADAVGYWKCELSPDTSGELTDEHKVWKGVQAPVNGVGETSNTTVGSTTENSSATTVPPMHSPAHITSPSELQQQPQTATPSQFQQPRGLVGDQELHIPMEGGGLTEPTQSVQHNLSAAKVKSKLDSPEYQAFRRHLAVLSDGISDPGWLAIQLYSRDMISRDMKREAELETTPAPMRTRKLLSAVEDQIVTSPEPKFGDFLYILHSEPSLDHLARKLEEACSPKEDVQLMETDSGVDGGAATETVQPKPVCQDQRLQEPEEQVQPTVMQTDSGVDGGPATEAAQPNKVSQYQRLKEPKEEVRNPFETHSEVIEGAQTLKEVCVAMETLSREMQALTAEVQAILEVHSELDEDCPTVMECIAFQGRERTLNIPREIGSNYSQFGILLLNDPNGTKVSNIEDKHREDAEQINTEILREWATGRGKQPVSWETLTEVLRNIGLGALASEIEDMKQTMSTIL